MSINQAAFHMADELCIVLDEKVLLGEFCRAWSTTLIQWPGCFGASPPHN